MGRPRYRLHLARLPRKLLVDLPVFLLTAVWFWCVATCSLILSAAIGFVLRRTRGLRYRLGWLLHVLLFDPLFRALRSIEKRFSGRRLEMLLVGSPALIVAGLVVAAGIWQARKPSSALVDRYRAAAGTALQKNHLPAAEVYLRKLLQLNPGDLEIQYQLAVVADRQGKKKQADEIISRLAPEAAAGYPEAHFVVAARLAQGKERWTKEELKRLIHHLRACLSSRQLRLRAFPILGQVYLAAGDLREALACFQAVVEERPELRLSIADVLSRMGKTGDAARELERAVAHCEARLRANSEDVESRVVLAKAYYLQGRPGDAERLLRERLRLPDRDRCRAELVGLWLSEAERVARSDDPRALGRMLELLDRALELWPDATEALRRVHALLDPRGGRPPLSEGLLKDLLAAGRAPATAHLLLGIEAALESQPGTAAVHLELACHINPRMRDVLDWLIAAWAGEDAAGRRHARLLADAAATAWPGDEGLRATRHRLHQEPEQPKESPEGVNHE